MDSNDNAPVFTDNPLTAHVMEGPGGINDHPVLTVTATDEDQGNNSHITFTFGQENSEFEIITVQEQNQAKVI